MKAEKLAPVLNDYELPANREKMEPTNVPVARLQPPPALAPVRRLTSVDSIPHGFCRCGCGQRTRIAKRSRPYLGHVKGEPLPYLHAHAGQRRSAATAAERAESRHPERFYAKVSLVGNCREWLGRTMPNGYGVYWLEGRKQYAHRVAYELAKGPIPDGLQIDHLCKNRRCVNPDHLEAVTQAENLRRGDRWR